MSKKQLKELKENECIEFKNKDERDKLCRLLHNNNYSLNNGVSYLDTRIFLHNYNHGVICVKQGLWDEIGAVSSNFKLYPLSDFIDDFVLPEKWCIKQNISQEVCDWFKKTLGVNALLEGGFEYLNNFELGLNGFFSNHIRENTTEITFEQFKEHVLKQNNKMEQNEKINISYKVLITYYEASTPDQKKYLNDHFSLSGDTTVEAIKGLYDIACDPWKAKIKANHPEIFKNDKVWKRNNIHLENKDYYYVTRHLETGFGVDYSTNNNINLNCRFETKEEAENEAFLYSTMMLMRSWVKHHNELDNFVVDWTSKNYKYILQLIDSKIYVEHYVSCNYGVFQLAVSSKQRAKELLKEFEQDIKKLIELKLI